MTTMAGTIPHNQESLLEGLRRLSASLRDADPASTFNLSHYRQLPETIGQAREFLQTGASLVKETSTKYTLLGSIDQNEQGKRTEDLMKGCQFVATGCVLIHEPSQGCSRAFRRHVKQACRAIVDAVVQLVAAFSDGTAIEQENMGAQKTGVVWQACDLVLEKKVPIGNRNSIRRDLFTYMMECQETMDEFQQLIDLGPTTGMIEQESSSREKQDNGSDDSAWEKFLSGQDQQYTSPELAIATACLALVKCTRGSINLTLQACEAVGAQIQEGITLSPQDKARLEWLEQLYRMACKVGDGMTDFGTNLYPPLDLNILPEQIELQSMNCISPVVDFVLDASLLEDGTTIEFPEDVVTLASKLKAAIQNRRTEALDSVAAATTTESQNTVKHP